ncbi:uncharacterized protein LOC122876716 isoform X3 [Siniperca chuatsi]|uniref:uncharacterized protein LOC122876716 isoform X3 n=1 Tax=Siniperca chuatsi TaxID=119488 RepID=UPI001CE07A04|nr:uncharacterized protein LOC122876716 isoform X3 [Siniperca chuatsi]
MLRCGGNNIHLSEQQWQQACVFQKAFSALISNMNGLTISLLLCAPVLAQCFPVAASQDHSKICDFISAITSPPVTTEGMVKDRAKHGLIVGGVGTLLLLIVGLYFCKKRGDQEQSQQATDVIEPLSEMQSPGETTEGDTRVHPGLNDDISPSQCDDGTSVFALICSEFGK